MKDIKFENVTTEQAAKLSELYAALKGDGIGELSDGYHTFNELYHHRAILFSVICNTHIRNWHGKANSTMIRISRCTMVCSS